jgi:hypothetical protein
VCSGAQVTECEKKERNLMFGSAHPDLEELAHGHEDDYREMIE